MTDRSRLRQAGGYPQILLCFPYVPAIVISDNADLYGTFSELEDRAHQSESA